VRLAEAIKRAKRVYIIGNGGSYANAVHIANDLLSCGVKAYTLDPATLTATANDLGYQNVFSRWLAVVGEPGDLLIALSGSGNSLNIINALMEAERIGMETWAITGEFNKDSQAMQLAGECIRFGKDMQQAEDRQIHLGHRAMAWLKSS
jgi:D-sedoheptulose 7-phosphate isomerase